jgi:predicted ArsR family transcriptional regulator
MSTLLRDRLKEKPFPVRLQELARFQSEQGYMAEITHDDSGIVWLVKYNCAICVAARQHPSACCAGDLPMLKELLGEVEIVQEEAILDGDHTCTFRIHDCSQRMQED